MPKPVSEKQPLLFGRACRTSETVPAELLHAQVVSIFKKGDAQNIANYRPISLYNL